MTSTAAALPLPARTDVAIVGAGPTGLALAVTLAEAGIDFVLLDRQAEGANTSRAGVVHARTLEVFDELDPSGALSAELVGRGIPVSRFRIRDGARPVAAVSFDGLRGRTAYPYALMVPQYETEAVLLARLRALGGEVHRPYEVTGVTQDSDGVTLTTADGQTLRAAHAVGADGMHSTVRGAAGIPFTGASYAESFVLADVVMEWSPGPREVSLTFGPVGPTIVAPLPGGRYRVVSTVAEAAAPAAPDLAYMQRLLDGLAPGQATVRDLAWSSRFRIHHRVADRYRAGRLLLAGDAAHVHSPAGGQGMNTGIQDAYALGRALAAGDVDGYEAARRPVALRVVALTDRMTRFSTTRNPALRLVRNTGLRLVAGVPALNNRAAAELAELNYR
ncbi:FAD-dependent monooxygenase [Streptomyces sp. BR123]|uniref:FAD-dependent oxidoreductase n=1 Tax=Streptomyces sp. BR123 TaxID=2749828 RepID=UPI0015C486D5|nr:FAD-dependent oxidoreductase [Streptomyces sp. BR123]NXY98373.1 FAD-dependent monooxygenase [Streptomyces sp. BR123]